MRNLRCPHGTLAPCARGAVTVAVLLATTAGAAAAPHYELGAEASVATPLGSFADHAPPLGVGVGFGGGIGLAGVPALLTAHLGYDWFGETAHTRRLAEVPDLALRTASTTQYVTGTAGLRLQATHWRVRPYAEGFVGFHFFDLETRSTVEDTRGSPLTPASSIELGTESRSDVAPAYGAGAGCDFVFATRTKDGKPSPALMAIRLGARYAVGGQLTLVQARTVGEAPDDRVVFPARETHPRLLVVHLGFALLFGGSS